MSPVPIFSYGQHRLGRLPGADFPCPCKGGQQGRGGFAPSLTLPPQAGEGIKGAVVSYRLEGELRRCLMPSRLVPSRLMPSRLVRYPSASSCFLSLPPSASV